MWHWQSGGRLDSAEDKADAQYMPGVASACGCAQPLTAYRKERLQAAMAALQKGFTGRSPMCCSHSEAQSDSRQ